ncbi:hypothetical protein WKR88_02085 [Trinickia caryophylli]|nr:hypothetical protein [Trinickia caryophylli]WQE12635.1 hypothetical protein U0034_04280 [Trinickia caryophylli]
MRVNITWVGMRNHYSKEKYTGSKQSLSNVSIFPGCAALWRAG